MKKSPDLTVDIPEDDGPSWGRVGVIAAIGFVVGIAWPKLAGVKLGPNAPNESAAAAAATAAMRASEGAGSSPAPVASGKPAGGAQGATSAAGAATRDSAPSTGITVAVARGAVISCKTDSGENLKGSKDCGPSGFDIVAQPRLKNLGQCTAAAQAGGSKLSAVFTVDYGSGRMDMNVGKSSSVKDPDAFLACMRTEFNGVVLKGLSHAHPRYVVAYAVSFDTAKEAPVAETKPGEKPGAGDAKPVTGDAQVTWETALVRDTPKTGTIVARLPRGTKVTPSISREGWFKVTYPDGEGWVYRGAIGR